MVIALGLEAAEITLIKKYASQGHLPFIKKLLDKNNVQEALSPSSISSGSTWASVNTGTNPGKHGVGFYHRQLQNGTYTIVKKYAEEIVVKPFWHQLNNLGLRMAILDPPEIYPLENFNGIILAGWGGEGLNHKRSSWPKNLLKNCIKKYGDHPLTNWYQHPPETLEGWKSFFNNVETGLLKRTEMYCDLLMQEDWDLFYAGAAEPHWIGHYFWHFIEPGHPSYSAEFASELENSVLKIYKLADELASKLSKLRPEAKFILFSNTGMGPNYSGRHLAEDVLAQLGYMYRSKSPGSGEKRSGARGVKIVEDTIGHKNVALVKKLLPERFWDKWTRRYLTRGNKWHLSKVFPVPADYTACFRVNLKGREPNGMVNPGKEYNEICEEIKDIFLNLKNPETGKNAVKDVILIKDYYKGEQLNELPDIAVLWAGDAPINALESDSVIKVNGSLPDKRTGSHMPYGFIAFEGLDKQDNIKIEDIAPTILGMMDRPIPDYMDGVNLYKKEVETASY